MYVLFTGRGAYSGEGGGGRGGGARGVVITGSSRLITDRQQ